MLGLTLALLASCAWGISDYLGGLKTRTVSLPRVLAISQLTGLGVLAVPVVIRQQAIVLDGRLGFAAAAGLASVCGLALIYTAMARGSIAVVAPVAASSAILPVLVGVSRGDSLSLVAASGIALALLGSVGAAWAPAPIGSRREMAAGGLLAFAAAAAVGLFFTLLELASRDDPYWAVITTRATACAAVIFYLAIRPNRQRATVPTSKGTFLALMTIGVFDALAEVFFAVASTSRELSLVSALSSLDTVVTVALALVVLGERMSALQACGVASALIGVFLLVYP